MTEHRITVERATPANVAPYGHMLAAHDDIPIFASWPGTEVFGTVPITVGDGGEMLLVRTAARTFPVQCTLIERHFKHSQAYIPVNGKPFVMLLGAPTEGDLPDYANLRALLFDDCAGIILHADVWHDFPYATEDATQFAVVLRQEAHVNTNDAPEHPMDADGPDLQRRSLRPRAAVFVDLP